MPTADILYLAVGLGSFLLFFGMLLGLDEHSLDRRR